MFARLATTLLLLALAAPPVASAWTWPAAGEVIRGFDYGGGPYTASGHRGIDIAGTVGSDVSAPAAGRVTFSGSLPTNGRTVSIRTEDGWAVTLMQLGSVTVSVGDGVAEGETVGTIAQPADQATVPHIQLGTRRADDPRGYVDPLTLLPSRQPAPAPVAVPVPAMPVPQPAPVALEPAPVETTRPSEALRGAVPPGATPPTNARLPRAGRLSNAARTRVMPSTEARPPSKLIEQQRALAALHVRSPNA